MGQRIDLPAAEVAGRYLAGESENALARSFKVDRNCIRRHLLLSGVQPRGQTEANRLMMAARSPEENRRNSEAAHAAARGRKHTLDERCRQAQTREKRPSNVGRFEHELAAMLRQAGVDFVPQKAVGPYNCDFAVGSVAVEVFGGYFHWFGRHFARLPERLHYFADRGFDTWVVNIGRRAPIAQAALDDLITFFQHPGGDPSARREYRMIWGTGELIAAGRLDGDQTTTVEALKRTADTLRPRKGSRW